MTKHTRVHTGDKPYKCNVCQKDFAIKENLDIRKKIHTGKKPYKFDACQKVFLHQAVRLGTKECKLVTNDINAMYARRILL